MRPHTDEEILGKANLLTPPPQDHQKDNLYVEIEFTDLGEPIKYEVYYEKGIVRQMQGWIPREIKQVI